MYIDRRPIEEINSLGYRDLKHWAGLSEYAIKGRTR